MIPAEIEAACEVAAADAGRAKASELRFLAMLHLHEVQTKAEPERNAPDKLVGKLVAAMALGVSPATLDRLCAQGAPFERVGSRRKFELEEMRAWLRTRGARPTTPKSKPPEQDAIDVGPALVRAGLRSSAGPR
jgi:hypothetical protein